MRLNFNGYFYLPDGYHCDQILFTLTQLDEMRVYSSLHFTRRPFKMVILPQNISAKMSQFTVEKTKSL